MLRRIQEILKNILTNERERSRFNCSQERELLSECIEETLLYESSIVGVLVVSIVYFFIALFLLRYLCVVGVSGNEAVWGDGYLSAYVGTYVLTFIGGLIVCVALGCLLMLHLRWSFRIYGILEQLESFRYGYTICFVLNIYLVMDLLDYKDPGNTWFKSLFVVLFYLILKWWWRKQHECQMFLTIEFARILPMYNLAIFRKIELYIYYEHWGSMLCDGLMLLIAIIWLPAVLLFLFPKRFRPYELYESLETWEKKLNNIEMIRTLIRIHNGYPTPTDLKIEPVQHKSYDGTEYVVECVVRCYEDAYPVGFAPCDDDRVSYPLAHTPCKGEVCYIWKELVVEKTSVEKTYVQTDWFDFVYNVTSNPSKYIDIDAIAYYIGHMVFRLDKMFGIFDAMPGFIVCMLMFITLYEIFSINWYEELKDRYYRLVYLYRELVDLYRKLEGWYRKLEGWYRKFKDLFK